MFDRENFVGFLLLGLCVAVGGVLVYSIVTDTSVRYDGPGWLGIVVGVFFFGALIYGLAGSTRRWPHPLTGRRGWRFWRRDKDNLG
jgi:hypothetical protein